MVSKGEVPVSSLIQSEVSATHTPHVGDDQGYKFPLEGFPFIIRDSSLSYPDFSDPILPHGYTSLDQLVLGTSSALSLYQNPI